MFLVTKSIYQDNFDLERINFFVLEEQMVRLKVIKPQTENELELGMKFCSEMLNKF